MKTSRLVVLTVAVGTSGVCAGLARGSDGYASPAGEAEQPQTARLRIVRIDAGVVQPMAPARPRAQAGSARTVPDSSYLAAVTMIATRSGDQALGITVDRRRAQSPTAPK